MNRLDIFQKKLCIKIKKGYLDILEDYILVFFGSGKSILIDKKLENQEFDYKDLKNNLSELNLFDQKSLGLELRI